MSDTTTPIRSNRADWFLMVLLVISLLGNVMLGVSFVRISQQLGQTPPATAQQQGPHGPEVGTVLPAMDVRTLQGSRTQIAYGADAKPTLIYVFSPTCHWCERNLANLKQLIAAERDTYRIVGLSLDTHVDEYLKKTGLDIPVYVDPSGETSRLYGLGVTPQTIVMSADGTVLKSWPGAFGGKTGKEVTDFFHVKLPGLAPAVPVAATGN